MMYGIGKDDIVLILGNSAGMSLNIFLWFLKVKYSRKPSKSGAIYVYALRLLAYLEDSFLKLFETPYR